MNFLSSRANQLSDRELNELIALGFFDEESEADEIEIGEEEEEDEVLVVEDTPTSRAPSTLPNGSRPEHFHHQHEHPSDTGRQRRHHAPPVTEPIEFEVDLARYQRKVSPELLDQIQIHFQCTFVEVGRRGGQLTLEVHGQERADLESARKALADRVRYPAWLYVPPFTRLHVPETAEDADERKGRAEEEEEGAGGRRNEGRVRILIFDVSNLVICMRNTFHRPLSVTKLMGIVENGRFIEERVVGGAISSLLRQELQGLSFLADQILDKSGSEVAVDTHLISFVLDFFFFFIFTWCCYSRASG